ncbi:MAG TPA: glycosyltransferase [Paludibacteraceae bacterium]|nr:glycosyltransferase [Paludibacteraceae bacterium]
MISIIVCSKYEQLPTAFVENVAATVGVEYELIHIDNSKQTYSIFSAYNEGVKRSNYTKLCFVHEDVLFLTQDWGKKIAVHLSNPEIGVIGIAGGDAMTPVPTGWYALNYSMHLVQSNNDGTKSEHLLYPLNYDQSTRSVAILDGVFLCMRKELFQLIRFDEQLRGFHGYDLDISVQALVAGYKNLVVYDVLIEHFSKGVFGWDYYKNLIYITKKWEAYLPLFESSVSEEEKEHLMQRKSRWLARLCKVLVRANVPYPEIRDTMRYYTNHVGSLWDKMKLWCFPVRVWLIRITSKIRKKTV